MPRGRPRARGRGGEAGKGVARLLELGSAVMNEQRLYLISVRRYTTWCDVITTT